MRAVGKIFVIFNTSQKIDRNQQQQRNTENDLIEQNIRFRAA